jgi:hypothetical protein
MFLVPLRWRWGRRRVRVYEICRALPFADEPMTEAERVTATFEHVGFFSKAFLGGRSRRRSRAAEVGGSGGRGQRTWQWRRVERIGGGFPGRVRLSVPRTDAGHPPAAKVPRLEHGPAINEGLRWVKEALSHGH